MGDTVVCVGRRVGLGVCPSLVGDVEGERDGEVGLVVMEKVGLAVGTVGLSVENVGFGVGYGVGYIGAKPHTSSTSAQQSSRLPHLLSQPQLDPNQGCGPTKPGRGYPP